MEHNPYIPKTAEIIDIKQEVGGARAIKTFKTVFVNGDKFSHKCGQCAMISVLGKGEAMISIASSPLETNHLQFSIMKMGRVTSALHDMEKGAKIGIRGPYGNNFPIENWKGKNLIFIGGGIGLAPIWSVLQTVLKERDQYKDISLFYGARTSKDIIFKEDLEKLKEQINVHLSIDVKEPEWNDFVGFVPQNVQAKEASCDNSIAVICGPPIMIKFVIHTLKSLHFEDEQIYTTLENKMKCGIGKCGRCNIGHDYVCKDGPVYSWTKLEKMPAEYW